MSVVQIIAVWRLQTKSNKLCRSWYLLSVWSLIFITLQASERLVDCFNKEESDMNFKGIKQKLLSLFLR